ALTGLLARFRDDRSRTRRRILEAEGDRPVSPLAAERHRRITEALAEVTASAQSPERTVAIGVHATKGFRVTIRAGTLNRLGAAETMAELDAAISIVLSRYRRASARAYDEVYVHLGPEKLERQLDEREHQH